MCNIAYQLELDGMKIIGKEGLGRREKVLTDVFFGGFCFKVRFWLGAGEMPSDTEEALLLWINRAVLAIKDYIQNNNAHEHNLVSVNFSSSFLNYVGWYCAAT